MVKTYCPLLKRSKWKPLYETSKKACKRVTSQWCPFQFCFLICGWIIDAYMVLPWFCPMVATWKEEIHNARDLTLNRQETWAGGCWFSDFCEEKETPSTYHHLILLYIWISFFPPQLNINLCSAAVVEHGLFSRKHYWSLATYVVVMEGLVEGIRLREAERLWVNEYLCSGTGNCESRLVWSKLILLVVFPLLMLSGPADPYHEFMGQKANTRS